jgi:hypothetical protein
VRKTAREKRSQAFRAFFLSPLLLRILVRRSSITAKAHGLILSATAAGSITQKKLSLFEREISEFTLEEVSSTICCSACSTCSICWLVFGTSKTCSSCAKVPQKGRRARKERERRIFILFIRD